MWRARSGRGTGPRLAFLLRPGTGRARGATGAQAAAPSRRCATLADSHKVRSAGFHTWTDGESDTFRAKHETGSKARLALELLFGTGAARQDAAALRVATRSACSAPTFAEAFETDIAIHAGNWKLGDRTEEGWCASLRDYALPPLGDTPVDAIAAAIAAADVMDVLLLPIWFATRTLLLCAVARCRPPDNCRTVACAPRSGYRSSGRSRFWDRPRARGRFRCAPSPPRRWSTSSWRRAKSVDSCDCRSNWPTTSF